MTTMLRYMMRARMDVYRDAYSPDGRGGRTTVNSKVSDDMRCRIDLPNAAEKEAAAQLGAEVAYIIYVQADEDVQRGDRLDIGLQRKLRTLSVIDDPSGLYSRITCEMMQGE